MAMGGGGFAKLPPGSKMQDFGNGHGNNAYSKVSIIVTSSWNKALYMYVLLRSSLPSIKHKNSPQAQKRASPGRRLQ